MVGEVSKSDDLGTRVLLKGAEGARCCCSDQWLVGGGSGTSQWVWFRKVQGPKCVRVARSGTAVQRDWTPVVQLMDDDWGLARSGKLQGIGWPLLVVVGTACGRWWKMLEKPLDQGWDPLARRAWRGLAARPQHGPRDWLGRWGAKFNPSSGFQGFHPAWHFGSCHYQTHQEPPVISAGYSVYPRPLLTKADDALSVSVCGRGFLGCTWNDG